jgi:hypothetical protein
MLELRIRGWSVSLLFGVGRLGDPFDRVQAPVPLGGHVGHDPAGLFEALGLNLVQNLPTLSAPADQPGLFEYDQMFRYGLAGERHSTGQPAGADRTIADDEVEHSPAGRVAYGRPQLIVGWPRHPY